MGVLKQVLETAIFTSSWSTEVNYKVQEIIFLQNKSLNFNDFEKKMHNPFRYKVIQKIKWKSSPGIPITAPFTQSRTKAAGFVSIGVGFWWERKLKQENINLVFWGSLKLYELEMESNQDWNRCWWVIEGNQIPLHVLSQAASLSSWSSPHQLAHCSSTFLASSMGLWNFYQHFSEFPTILQYHDSPNR